MNSQYRILAIVVTFNRCEITLRALNSIKAQILPPEASLNIALVDDASTDGTLDAVRAKFPDIFLLKSTGNLFWAGAMRLGFKSFWMSNRYTHLLVFNDDCIFYPNAISQMINSYRDQIKRESYKSIGSVVVGSFHDGYSDMPTYGGQESHSSISPVMLRPLKPSSDIQYADTLNMNLALIDKATIDAIGFISNSYAHGFGDFDFGFRAKERGVKIIVIPGFQGICLRNSKSGTWEDSKLDFATRLRLIVGPKGLSLAPRLHYLKTHAGIFWPLIYVWPYLKFIFNSTLGAVSRHLRS